MSPYGDSDDSDSTASFSVMGDGDDKVCQLDKLKSDISDRLRKRPRKLNILVIGPPGVGKSAFITSLATALSGHFHEYSLSGHHGGDSRPITFFMKRFENCCLDEEYRERYSGSDLPTLVDMAGMPNESNSSVYEEILRTVLYGRLPLNMSIAQAEEILKLDGVKELRKRCPNSDPDLKIDRILFLSSATEKALSQELIKCVVNTCRPSGTSTNSKTRAIPLYGVMTKLDKLDKKDGSSEEYKALETKFQEALGIKGSGHRFIRCTNYCDDTAPERCEVNSRDLDIPLLKFFKQLLDPFVNVDFDEEQEDYSHLCPPPPPLPQRVNRLDHYLNLLVNFHGQTRQQKLQMVAGFVGLLFLIFWLFSGSSINMQALRTTCIRVKDLNTGGSVRDLPELADVCKSLDNGCNGNYWLFPGLFLIAYAILGYNRP